MSSLCSWMSERRRSRGPSNWGSATAKGASRVCAVSWSTPSPLRESHGGADLLHRLARDPSGLLGAEADQLLDATGMPIEVGARGAVLLQRRHERLEQPLLAVDTADAGAAAADLHVPDARRRAGGAMQVVDGAHLRVAGIVAALSGRVGDSDHDPLAGALRILAELDGVAVALRHLPAVETEDLGRVGEVRLRLDQHGLSFGAVEEVEPPHELTGELQVRDLILADRHRVGVVDRHVRGLQHRVAEKAEVVQVLVLELLL